MFTFTIAARLPGMAIVGLQPHRILRRFATLNIAITAFLALARMSCGAGDEFPVVVSISPNCTVSRTVDPPDDTALPGKPDDEAFSYSRHSSYSVRRSAVPPSRSSNPTSVPERGGQNSSSERERTQRKLTSRYGNPMTVQMVRSLSPGQSIEFYQEVSRLIDSHHLDPPAYETRVERALWNLRQALANDAFRQANGISNDSATQSAFRRELLRLSDESIATRRRQTKSCARPCSRQASWESRRGQSPWSSCAEQRTLSIVFLLLFRQACRAIRSPNWKDTSWVSESKSPRTMTA